MHHAMASAASGLACRNLRVTALLLRAGPRVPRRPKTVVGKSQIWSWANGERKHYSGSILRRYTLALRFGE